MAGRRLAIAAVVASLAGAGAWAADKPVEKSAARPADKPVDKAGAAGDKGVGPVALSPAEREAKARAYFTDAKLLAQDGRPMRFYTDVLKDHVVLVNFVFTECGDACPLITQKLIEARKALGADAKGIRFVSISIDPQHDTPAAMAAFAKKQNAVDPDWFWMTGAPADIEAVTKRLGAFTDDRTDHFTGILVGNLKTDRWRKVRPDVPPEVLAVTLRQIAGLEPVPAAKAP